MKPESKYSVVFEPLQAAYYEESVACLNYQFVYENPLNKALRITIEEHLSLTQEIVKEAIKQKISVVALDKETRQLLGVMICLDLETPHFVDIEKTCPRIAPIFDMMDQMKNKYRATHHSKPGEVVESFMTAVYNQYAGRGVTYGLLNTAVPLWIQNGYSKVVGCLAHPVTQHIILSHPKISIFDQVKTKDYEYKGTRPFKDVTELSSCIFTQSESYRDLMEPAF